MSARAQKVPDEMGIWAEADPVVWLSKSLYPRRSDAIKWAVEQLGVGWTEVRCRSRSMRWDPDGAAYGEGEDWWTECERDHPDAFPVWRIE